MKEFWVLVEENIAGVPVLRKIAATGDGEAAKTIYTAIRDSGTYEKVFLVEVLDYSTGVL